MVLGYLFVDRIVSKFFVGFRRLLENLNGRIYERILKGIVSYLKVKVKDYKYNRYNNCY